MRKIVVWISKVSHCGSTGTRKSELCKDKIGTVLGPEVKTVYRVLGLNMGNDCEPITLGNPSNVVRGNGLEVAVGSSDSGHI